MIVGAFILSMLGAHPFDLPTGATGPILAQVESSETIQMKIVAVAETKNCRLNARDLFGIAQGEIESYMAELRTMSLVGLAVDTGEVFEISNTICTPTAEIIRSDAETIANAAQTGLIWAGMLGYGMAAETCDFNLSGDDLTALRDSIAEGLELTDLDVADTQTLEAAILVELPKVATITADGRSARWSNCTH